jgi:tryptophan synthase beta subunit
MLVAANTQQTVNTGTTDSDAVIAELQEYYMKLHSKTYYFLKNIHHPHPCPNTPFNFERTAVSLHEARLTQ